MPIPTNKDELLTAITTSYSKLLSDLESITPEDADLPELPGHRKDSVMSIRDLVAYLIGWGKLVLKWHRKKENNEPVDFPESGFQWNELGLLAQKFYADHQTGSYSEQLIEFQQTVTALTTLINNSDPELLYQPGWYKQWSQGRMIQLNTASPYKNARTRVRKWKKNRPIH